MYPHICDNCGKEHMVSSSTYYKLNDGRQKRSYCSKKCADESKHTGREIICDNCGKSFYRRQYHIDRQKNKSGLNFCCKECEADYKHNSHMETRICEVCGNEYECKKISSQRFCSIQCQGKWQSTRVGKMNPRYRRVETICKYCGKPYDAKRYKVEQGITNYCSAECRQAYYRDVICKTDEFIELHRKCALDNLHNGKFSKTNSLPQQIVDNTLNELGITFIREYPIKRYSIDNYLPDNNLMIEVMGDFWHYNPTRYEQNSSDKQSEKYIADKEKHDYVFETFGVQILYLWEYDIEHDLEKCKRMILEYIENNGILDAYHSFNYCNDKQTYIPY